MSTPIDKTPNSDVIAKTVLFKRDIYKDQLCTIEFACIYLSLSRSSVERLIEAGELGPVVKIGRIIRLYRREVQDYIDRLLKKEPPKEPKKKPPED